MRDCRYAGVTQLVEYLPSKQTVARSSRVARSIFYFSEMLMIKGFNVISFASL